MAKPATPDSGWRRAAPASRASGVPPFLNSPIFLWFLSSVVLSGLSFAYTQWRKGVDAERQQFELAAEKQRVAQRTASQLDAEIAGRLSYVAAVANVHLSMSGKEAPATGTLPASAIPALREMNEPKLLRESAQTFQEYSARSLRSLLWELATVVPADEVTAIRAAYNATDTLVMLQVLDDVKLAQSISTLEALGDKDLLERMEAGDQNARKLIAQRNLKSSADFFLVGDFVRTFNLPRWGCPFKVLNFPMVQVFEGEKGEAVVRHRENDPCYIATAKVESIDISQP